MVEELELAGVAEVLLDDWVPDEVLDPEVLDPEVLDPEVLDPEVLDAELVVELVLVLVGVLATALPIGLAAITPTSPVNATPVSAVVTRRARAAGWRRREPGRPAVGDAGPGNGEVGTRSSLRHSLVVVVESQDPPRTQGVCEPRPRTW